MTVSPPPAVLVSDVFFCLGLGFLLGMALELLAFFFPGQVGRFLLDVLGFVLAAVLLTSFGLGRSGAGVPRWFHAIGLLAGVLVWSQGPGSAVKALRDRMTRPLRQRIEKHRAGKGDSGKKSFDVSEKQLPKKDKVLYNS